MVGNLWVFYCQYLIDSEEKIGRATSITAPILTKLAISKHMEIEYDQKK